MRTLLEKGASALPYPLPVDPDYLKLWLDEHILPDNPQITQPRLF